MRVQLNRRDALLRTAAMATASALFPGVAAPAHALSGSGEIDAALRARVDASDAAGIVAMAATEGSIVYQGAFGLRANNAAAKMSADTVFRIASMVKLLTSVAAMQLVEAGKLDLDAPATAIDPALASHLVLSGFDAKGTPQLRPPKKPVTLRHLLSHTSGFSYPLWDTNVVRYLKFARLHPGLPRRPLMFDPGDRWAYGGGLDEVSRLVEISSGKAIDRYFRDHITGPLGMDDTAFAKRQAARA